MVLFPSFHLSYDYLFIVQYIHLKMLISKISKRLKSSFYVEFFGKKKTIFFIEFEPVSTCMYVCEGLKWKI